MAEQAVGLPPAHPGDDWPRSAGRRTWARNPRWCSSGHRCQGRHGDVHEDNRYLARATFDALDGDQRIARYAAEYAARGWTLTDISPAYHLPRAAGEAWSFTFVPARQLWSLPITAWR